HTRSYGDWSSDVCSSDLAVMEQAVWKRGALGVLYFPDPAGFDYPLNSLNYPDQIKWVTLPAESEDRKPPTFAFVLSHRQGRVLRSEERRVGKECRSWWSR